MLAHAVAADCGRCQREISEKKRARAAILGLLISGSFGGLGVLFGRFEARGGQDLTCLGPIPFSFSTSSSSLASSSAVMIAFACVNTFQAGSKHTRPFLQGRVGNTLFGISPGVSGFHVIFFLMLDFSIANFPCRRGPYHDGILRRLASSQKPGQKLRGRFRSWAIRSLFFSLLFTLPTS